jgi:nitrogen fixation/metabolism regulation signal transduction histidine kinase
MVYRNFRVNIIIRIIMLFAAITACALFIVQAEYIRLVYLAILVIVLVVEMFYYIDRVNRDLSQFLISVLHDEYTLAFKERERGKSFRGLYKAMNDISLKLQTLSKEKETRNQYLFSLIEQVKVGIISYEPSGRVHLVNQAFNELLATPAIQVGTDLKDREQQLFSILESVGAGERQLVKMKIQHEEKEFSIQSAGFRIEDQDFKLVSVQNIREELDERELEAWQKLIRVLTHEIMNSVTPITSLASSLYDIVDARDTTIGSPQLKERLVSGLGAVRERSAGLIKFTTAYQDIAKIPAPVIKTVQTAELISRLQSLFAAEMREGGIDFEISGEGAPGSFRADINLLEQVIINLIRNARDAVTMIDKPSIHITMSSNEGRQVSIKVRDNGQGIPDDTFDRIFVPFFSTKESGTGIGLSLSRQIIIMHKGTLEVDSMPGKTTFEILL